MSSLSSTQAVKTATAVSAGLLAVPLFAGLVWTVWRLVFWGVAATAPTVRGVHPMHTPIHGPERLVGVDAFATGGGTGFGPFSLFLLALVAVALLVTVLVALSPPDARVADAAAGDEAATRRA